MNRTTLTHLTMLAALSLVPAAVQTARAQTMTHDSMTMTQPVLAGLPMLRFTAQPGMNMMMNHSGDLTIMAAPGMGKYTYTMGGHSATLTFASRDAKALFTYYDKAIRAGGWKADMSMAMGMMGAGHYGEAYTMGTYKLDLSAVTSGARTAVTFKVH